MADLTRELDGDFTLEETKDACEVEQDELGKNSSNSVRNP